MERKRVRVTVSGQVQGVFFRSSVQELAGRHDVSGWVRNTRDGTVEAELEGAPEDVDAIVAFCREGPELAVVERVDVDDLEPTGDGTGGVEVR